MDFDQRIKKRTKKPKSLNMVHVKMAEENIDAREVVAKMRPQDGGCRYYPASSTNLRFRPFRTPPLMQCYHRIGSSRVPALLSSHECRRG